MSEKDWTLFIKDIYKSTNRIIGYTKNMTRQDFLQDYKTYDTTMRNLEIIGEAVKHLPVEARKKYKNIAWKKIAGLRDIVIHEYFGINEEIIWDVINNKIPELKIEIKKILNEIERK